MLRSFRGLLKRAFQIDSPKSQNEGHDLQLAAAALLVEAMHADHEAKAEERHHLRYALQSLFALTEQETRNLIDRAERRAEQAVSLYDFTSTIKDEFSDEQKKQLLVLMWRIVLSDSVLDRYEDHLLHQVAELIYVSHSQFMHAKHLAQQSMQA
jgi:uncharacterized tellurite resistance protein B-like protein